MHYPKTDRKVLMDFEYRATRVLMEICQSYRENPFDFETSKGVPDIICLQEVDHFDSFYKPHLTNMGYDTELHYRRNKDAELIGWKRDIFRLVKK